MAKPHKTLQLKLRSPYQNYFSGPALSVTGRNRLGHFDVLADHAPFFTLLAAGEITVRTEHEELKFNVDSGILKVKNNLVDIFLNV
ncbi:MAG TPA: hypothetical protein VLE72_00790 [Candidatus Saccharimonadales bacterium]|nr:hypothetical protein [Candidatus Saccharimonadales bacterium]